MRRARCIGFVVQREPAAAQGRAAVKATSASATPRSTLRVAIVSKISSAPGVPRPERCRGCLKARPPKSNALSFVLYYAALSH